MLELIDTSPDSNVQEAEYQRLLGYPRSHVLEGRSRELADRTRDWYARNGKPWIYARQTGSADLAEERLRINSTVFASKQLHDRFVTAEADDALLVVVSAGRECEEKAREFWREGKPDEYFFMEMYGSAVVEHLIATASGRLCAWADQRNTALLPHYSPGYSGWDVADQVPLWELIRQNRALDFPEDLEVMSTGMLRPKKSLLALFGITRHLDRVRNLANLIPCENCSLASCRYRRVPYQHALPQMEDVRRLQTCTDGISEAEPVRIPALNRNAKYSLNSRALRKWANQRLQLERLPDGSVNARFRYEGTTCSNLGLPLEFDYEVTLRAAEDGYTIADARCLPAPGDTGHQSMCEYLNQGNSLMRSIAEEKPLLGRSLNDVLAWQREFSPSGCYCDAASRAHKWGLALEVIHFALAQKETEAADTTHDTGGARQSVRAAAGNGRPETVRTE